MSAVHSNDYNLIRIPGNNYEPICLCGNERRTVSWMMSPTGLGQCLLHICVKPLGPKFKNNFRIVLITNITTEQIRTSMA